MRQYLTCMRLGIFTPWEDLGLGIDLGGNVKLISYVWLLCGVWLPLNVFSLNTFCILYFNWFLKQTKLNWTELNKCPLFSFSTEKLDGKCGCQRRQTLTLLTLLLMAAICCWFSVAVLVLYFLLWLTQCAPSRWYRNNRLIKNTVHDFFYKYIINWAKNLTHLL